MRHSINSIMREVTRIESGLYTNAHFSHDNFVLLSSENFEAEKSLSKNEIDRNLPEVSVGECTPPNLETAINELLNADEDVVYSFDNGIRLLRSKTLDLLQSPLEDEEVFERIVAVYEKSMALYNEARAASESENDPIWRNLYEKFFSARFSGVAFNCIRHLGLSTSYYDPDTSYQEDVASALSFIADAIEILEGRFPESVESAKKAKP